MAGGLAPDFDGNGFKKPGRVDLIKAGQHAGSLTSARSAKEYGLAPTGASSGEQADSLAMAGGELAPEAVLQALGEGLYVSNFWYMNYSDRPRCRMTGMTRFATFWVEGGKIVAPVSVVRFDDSLYQMFGEQGLEVHSRGTPPKSVDLRWTADREHEATRCPFKGPSGDALDLSQWGLRPKCGCNPPFFVGHKIFYKIVKILLTL